MLLTPILTFKSTKSRDFVLLTIRYIGYARPSACRLSFSLLLVEVGRILVVEACETEVIALAGLEHALVREECE